VAQTVGLRRKLTACVTLVVFGLLAGTCLPKPPAETGGGVNITLYGFSIMRESLEKGIYPAFTAKWKQEHGVDVRFTCPYQKLRP
jgi:ABC-type sulfate transport system substrate-binding protein